MPEEKKQLKLGLNLDDYRYEARHCTGQTLCRWIDMNYIQGHDFAQRCPTWQKEGFDVYGAVGKCNIVYYLLSGNPYEIPPESKPPWNTGFYLYALWVIAIHHKVHAPAA